MQALRYFMPAVDSVLMVLESGNELRISLTRFS